jgi:hypothetical protein
MTDIGGDELANKRIEQAAGHAQEILTAPSEQLAPPIIYWLIQVAG